MLVLIWVVDLEDFDAYCGVNIVKLEESQHMKTRKRIFLFPTLEILKPIWLIVASSPNLAPCHASQKVSLIMLIFSAPLFSD